ncbi:hypothetical protein THTE_0214 [Thermogutta terrifontis]|uniref:Uncharacterized protein n=1 Tax=Thermogutta terrifontis TaxID=1331910 RepID=A0A286RA34_9BACT|nr:hypothetical protein THTE_0214 [Thermogutta terrifontis]
MKLDESGKVTEEKSVGAWSRETGNRCVLETGSWSLKAKNAADQCFVGL